MNNCVFTLLLSVITILHANLLHSQSDECKVEFGIITYKSTSHKLNNLEREKSYRPLFIDKFSSESVELYSSRFEFVRKAKKKEVSSGKYDFGENQYLVIRDDQKLYSPEPDRPSYSGWILVDVGSDKIFDKDNYPGTIILNGTPLIRSEFKELISENNNLVYKKREGDYYYFTLGLKYLAFDQRSIINYKSNSVLFSEINVDQTVDHKVDSLIRLNMDNTDKEFMFINPYLEFFEVIKFGLSKNLSSRKIGVKYKGVSAIDGEYYLVVHLIDEIKDKTPVWEENITMIHMSSLEDTKFEAYSCHMNNLVTDKEAQQTSTRSSTGTNNSRSSNTRSRSYPARTRTSTRSASVQCSGYTKKGSRCRNKTKSSSGRCHLH